VATIDRAQDQFRARLLALHGLQAPIGCPDLDLSRFSDLVVLPTAGLPIPLQRRRHPLESGF
jgi:hypothetical protein